MAGGILFQTDLPANQSRGLSEKVSELSLPYIPAMAFGLSSRALSECWMVSSILASDLGKSWSTSFAWGKRTKITEAAKIYSSDERETFNLITKSTMIFES